MLEEFPEHPFFLNRHRQSVRTPHHADGMEVLFLAFWGQPRGATGNRPCFAGTARPPHVIAARRNPSGSISGSGVQTTDSFEAGYRSRRLPGR